MTANEIEQKLVELTKKLAEHHAVMDQIDDGAELFQMLTEQARLNLEINNCLVAQAQLVSKEINLFAEARSRF